MTTITPDYTREYDCIYICTKNEEMVQLMIYMMMKWHVVSMADGRTKKSKTSKNVTSKRNEKRRTMHGEHNENKLTRIYDKDKVNNLPVNNKSKRVIIISTFLRPMKNNSNNNRRYLNTFDLFFF